MTLNRWMANIIVFGLFVPLFVPFVVTGSMFFPFITGKAFTFRITIEILLGLYLILALREPAYRPRMNPVVTAYSIFVFILFLADLFGVNFTRSFWSNFERMEGLAAHLHLLAYLFLITVFFRKEIVWRTYLHTSLLASFLLSIYGFIQLSGKLAINQGGVRLDATFGNATYLAIYMLFHFFIAAYYLFRSQNVYAKWVYGLLMFIQSVILYYTATRGAILGFLGALFLMALLVAIFDTGRKRTVGAAVVAGLIVLILLFLGVRNTKFVQDSQVLSRFASISLTEQTTESRFLIWNMSYQGFKEHPILGWGQENYNIVFNKYYNPKLWKQEAWFDRAHNIFFDWLVAAGLIGILSYLSLFGVAIYLLWIKARDKLSVLDKSLFTALLAGYFFHNIFVFDNLISYILFLFVLAYISFITDTPGEKKTSGDKLVGLGHDLSVSFILLGTLLSLYLINVKPILASRALISSLNLRPENFSGSIGQFSKAISYSFVGKAEAREQLIQVASNVANAQNLDPKIKTAFFELAISEMSRQVEKVPNDARYPLFLGILLSRSGRSDEALSYFEKALALSPQKQTIMFELGNVYVQKGDFQKAFEVLEKAYLSDPEYPEAATVYAIGAAFVGKDEIIEKTLIPKFGISVINTGGRLVNAYAAKKEYPKIIRLWKATLEKEPNNLQVRISLAATYYANKEPAKAVQTLEEVIKLEPKFKEQGEKFIKQIKEGKLVL